MKTWHFICCIALPGLVLSCSPADHGRLSADEVEASSSRRIVSLDYCADQFVLKLAAPEEIAALSPDATATYSYLREMAAQFETVRPRTEDILLYNPDIVVRTYGGDPGISEFLRRSGIKTVQIGFASDLGNVRDIIRDTARQLNAPSKGEEVVSEMDTRLANLPAAPSSASVLYLTSKGAVAGRDTMIDDLIQSAGLRNFQDEAGWSSIPLETLAYEQPDIIATGFFESSDLDSDIWTPARHSVVRHALENTKTVDLPGAWTSCGAWFLVDAVEALAQAGARVTENGGGND